MQIMIQACARDGGAGELQAWCLQSLGPALLERTDRIEALIINLGMPAPVDPTVRLTPRLHGQQHVLKR